MTILIAIAAFAAGGISFGGLAYRLGRLDEISATITLRALQAQEQRRLGNANH